MNKEVKSLISVLVLSSLITTGLVSVEENEGLIEIHRKSEPPKQKAKPRTADQVAHYPPSIFSLMEGNHLSYYAKYCTEANLDDASKWARDYYCSVKASDVYSVAFSVTSVFLTVVLAIIGFLQFRVYRIQAGIMAQQNDVTVVTNRASIVARGIEPGTYTETGGGSGFLFVAKWEQTGLTPALSVQQFLAIKYVPYNKISDPPIPVFHPIFRGPPVTIPQGTSFSSEYMRIPTDQIKKAVARDIVIFINPCVQYQDTFLQGAERFTEATYQVVTHGDPTDRTKRNGFSFPFRGTQNTMK